MGTIHELCARNDVNALYAFLDEKDVDNNGEPANFDRYRAAFYIAAKYDNLPVLKHAMAKLDPVQDVTVPFYDAITQNSTACFMFLLSHPTLDVMHQNGVFFKHAIHQNHLRMLARLCCHRTANLDDPFLHTCIEYAATHKNYPAAVFLEAFITPVIPK
jgi:hypothetical protein